MPHTTLSKLLTCFATLVGASANTTVGSPADARSGRQCVVVRPYVGRATISVEQRIAIAREQHTKLRQLVNAPLPEAATTILIMLSSAHHSFTKLSYIATRNPDGMWTVDRVGRTTYEFPTMPAEVEPVTRRALSKEDGETLDALLADHCLYAQPFMAADNSLGPLGGWQTNLVVITPHGKYAGTASGPIPSIGGKVVTAVTGW